jgi:hypothetical protein
VTFGSSDKNEILEAIKEDEEFRQEIREQILSNDQTRQNQKDNNDQEFTRRGFLKTLGLGAGGLALSGLGASRVTITDQGIKKNGSPLVPFSFGSSKLSNNLNVNGNQIKDQTQTIYNPSEQHIPTTVIEQGSGSGLNADQLDGNQASNFATANDLSSHAGTTGAHHTKYTDNQARNAVNNANININGDADTVDGKDASDLGSALANPSNVQTASDGLTAFAGDDFTSDSDSTTLVDASGPGWVLRGRLARDTESSGDNSASADVNITVDGTSYNSFSREIIPAMYFNSSLTIEVSVSANAITGTPLATASASVNYIQL